MRWAHGSPLALRLGADAQVAGAAEDAVEPTAAKEVVASLIRRVVAAELEGAHPLALATATIARVVTPELLNAAMAGEGDPAAAYEWLRSRSFVEPLGGGLTLHEVVRRAMLVDLTLKDPALEHELRRRIADHLHARAVAGDSLMMIDLAHLVEDPVVRWGFSWEGSARFRVDTMGPGDAVTIDQLMARRGISGWLDMTQRILEDAPEVPIVVRDVDGEIRGHALSVTPAGAPAAADEDPLLGPWLAHARAQDDRRSVLLRESMDHVPEPEPMVQAMLGLAVMLRSGLSNVRYAYMPIPPGADRALRVRERLSARREPSLDTRFGPAPVECWILDYGPGGLIGTQRDVVYRELGLTPPADPGDRACTGPVDAEAVRAALRDFHKPVELRAARSRPARDRSSAPSPCVSACAPRSTRPSASPPTSSCCARCSSAATSPRTRASSRPPSSCTCRAPRSSGGSSAPSTASSRCWRAREPAARRPRRRPRGGTAGGRGSGRAGPARTPRCGNDAQPAPVRRPRDVLALLGDLRPRLVERVARRDDLRLRARGGADPRRDRARRPVGVGLRVAHALDGAEWRRPGAAGRAR